MTEHAAHPFVELEARLREPPADGMFVTTVTPGSPAAEAGLAAGDTIVAVGEERGPDRTAFFQAMQPQGEDDTTRTLSVLRADGSRVVATVPTPLRGCSACAVKRGTPAWDDRPDSDYEPDFSALEDGEEIWLRNSLGDEPAGFERILLRRRGDLLEADILFRLGGDDPEHGSWDYGTHALSTHRLDRTLSVVRTSFTEMGEETGDVALGDDGVWRGRQRGKEVEFRALAPVVTAYSTTLLPLTMPLAKSARLTFSATGDGHGRPLCRERFECTGRETVLVDGAEVEAFCFVQRHYGEYGVEERFYVSPERRLVRIDWGPNYGHCRAERVAKEHVLDGVPEHVRIE